MLESIEARVMEMVQLNFPDAVSVGSPDALQAFNAAKSIFDVSQNAQKLHEFISLHGLKGRIESRGGEIFGDAPYPFKRLWDTPVYLISDAKRGQTAGARQPETVPRAGG